MQISKPAGIWSSKLEFDWSIQRAARVSANDIQTASPPLTVGQDTDSSCARVVPPGIPPRVTKPARLETLPIAWSVCVHESRHEGMIGPHSDVVALLESMLHCAVYSCWVDDVPTRLFYHQLPRLASLFSFLVLLAPARSLPEVRCQDSFATVLQ